MIDGSTMVEGFRRRMGAEVRDLISRLLDSPRPASPVEAEAGWPGMAAPCRRHTTMCPGLMGGLQA